jgi:hypothetical protein
MKDSSARPHAGKASVGPALQLYRWACGPRAIMKTRPIPLRLSNSRVAWLFDSALPGPSLGNALANCNRHQLLHRGRIENDKQRDRVPVRRLRRQLRVDLHQTWYRFRSPAIIGNRSREVRLIAVGCIRLESHVRGGRDGYPIRARYLVVRSLWVGRPPVA